MSIQHYQADTYQARNSIGYLVRRSMALIIECLEPAVATQGLTFTQWLVLIHLRDGLVHNARGICSLLRHDSGSLTRVLDQLQERGLLTRQRSLEDRREVALKLTEAGSRALEALLPMIVERMNYALRDFSGEEVADLTRLLSKLMGSLAGNVAEGRRGAEASL